MEAPNGNQFYMIVLYSHLHFQLKIASLLNTLLQERYNAQIQFNIQLSKVKELTTFEYISDYELKQTQSKFFEAESKVSDISQKRK